MYLTSNHGQKSWDTSAFLGCFPSHTEKPTPPLNPQTKLGACIQKLFSEFQFCKQISKRMHWFMKEPRNDSQKRWILHYTVPRTLVHDWRYQVTTFVLTMVSTYSVQSGPTDYWWGYLMYVTDQIDTFLYLIFVLEEFSAMPGCLINLHEIDLGTLLLPQLSHLLKFQFGHFHHQWHWETLQR